MPLGFTTKSIDFSNPLNVIAGSLNISALVAKGSFVNLDTQETYKFLFNPSEVRKAPVKAVYEKVNVAFRSHPKYYYKYTDAHEWVFQLYLNSTSSGAQNLINIIALSKNINNDTAFLESLVHPIEGKGLENRRPPKVRFVWPNLVNQQVIVTSIGTVYTKFNFRLQQQVTLVDVTIAEVVSKTRTSNEVRLRGSTGRPGLLGALLDKLPGIGNAVESVASII